MRVVSPRNCMLDRRRIPRSTAGISLVELMVVVTIISMLFVAAVPTYQQVQRKARSGALVNNFRVFAGIFQAYAQERGGWPAESAAGVVPTGITSQDLKTDSWTQATPMGGKFDWENGQVHPGGTSPGGTWRAALAITGTSDAPLMIDADLLVMIDQALDDGNLNTGSFRLGFGNCPLFVIEP